MQTLPFDSSLAFAEEITLDGTPYVFRFLWNFRASCWMMGLYALDTTPILEGVKIVLNENLFANHAGEALPPGQLWAVSTSGSLAPIAQGDPASGAVQLVYLTEAEVAAL